MFMATNNLLIYVHLKETTCSITPALEQ